MNCRFLQFIHQIIDFFLNAKYSIAHHSVLVEHKIYNSLQFTFVPFTNMA